MNTQQRRPFFQTATTSIRGRRLRGWLAVILTALLCSCASLTPDRIAVLAALAGNAAQIGVSLWLDKNPDHRGSFEAVARAIAAFLAAQAGPGVAPEAKEATVAELLSSLPTPTLASKEGELYVSGDNLVIWDAKLKKASTVEGAAVEPVLKAVKEGMRRALVPKPPKPYPLPIRARESLTAVPQPITNLTPISTPLVVPAGKFAPRGRGVGIYSVERKTGTNWTEVQSFTSGPAEFRVRRVR